MADAVTAITGIARVRRVGAQPLERLDAVDAGQLDVHQDQAGCARAPAARPSSPVSASIVW